MNVALIRNRYYQNNMKYFVEFDNERKLIIFHDKENLVKQLFDFNAVKSIELYYSWNSSPFSSDLGYSKIIFLDGSSVFVTQNNINQYHIYKIFKKKVKVNKSKFANSLK